MVLLVCVKTINFPENRWISAHICDSLKVFMFFQLLFFLIEIFWKLHKNVWRIRSVLGDDVDNSAFISVSALTDRHKNTFYVAFKLHEMKDLLWWCGKTTFSEEEKKYVFSLLASIVACVCVMGSFAWEEIHSQVCHDHWIQLLQMDCSTHTHTHTHTDLLEPGKQCITPRAKEAIEKISNPNHFPLLQSPTVTRGQSLVSDWLTGFKGWSWGQTWDTITQYIWPTVFLLFITFSFTSLIHLSSLSGSLS